MTRDYSVNDKLAIYKGLDYVKSAPGALKVFEFIALLVAISCMSVFVDVLSNSRASWNFFLFVVISSFIITISTFCFFLVGFHEKLNAVDWSLVIGITFMIFTTLLLVAGAVLASNVHSYKVSGLCDSWAATRQGIDCDNLVVSTVFTFVAFILYGLDSLLHFWLSVVNGHDSGEETAEIETTQPMNDDV